MKTDAGSTVTMLAALFNSVAAALSESRVLLNEADPLNGNHGDHMVEAFNIVVQASLDQQGASLAETMDWAARLLEDLPENGSARVYAHGLHEISTQMQKADITLDELIVFINGALQEEKKDQGEKQNHSHRSGDVLKALLNGLANWNRIEEGKSASESSLDMGALFEFGMAYLQARKRGNRRIDILADAAVSASPLSRYPHRFQSGVIVVRTLLDAMQVYS